MSTPVRISNSFLSVEVSSLGAEMQSLTSTGGISWLWNGDAAFWTGRSPILFPIVGKAPDDTVEIDGKAYPMVTEGAAAWLASTGDESGFVAALKAGTQLVVRGTSQRGTNTTDTYSLRGVTAAMTEIDKACA